MGLKKHPFTHAAGNLIRLPIDKRQSVGDFVGVDVAILRLGKRFDDPGEGARPVRQRRRLVAAA